MASPLATFVRSAPEGAVNCGGGKLKIEAPNAAVASILAKMGDAKGLSEMIWAEVLNAFEKDQQLVALVSQMQQPRLLYTIDGAPVLKGKTWRLTFSAFLLDAS